MSDPEIVRAVANAWLDKAAGDLAAARLLLGAPPLDPALAGYHAQQAAEKALKAVLVARAAEVPRTHDLARLHAMVADATGPWAGLPSASELDGLTDLAISARYPTEEVARPLEREEAQRAIVLASAALDSARRLIDSR